MASFNRTAADHEKHLNELFSDSYSEEQAVDQFIYLTNKARGKNNTTTERNIRNAHTQHTLGTLLRRYDPIAFNASKSDKR